MIFNAQSFSFNVKYNEEELDPYSIPTQEFAFGGFKAEGDYAIDYMGFPLNGIQPLHLNVCMTNIFVIQVKLPRCL